MLVEANLDVYPHDRADEERRVHPRRECNYNSGEIGLD